MKSNINQLGAAVSAAALLATGLVSPAFAQVPNVGLGVNATATATVNTGGTGGVSGTAGIKLSVREKARVALAMQRADQEIARRINALNALNVRINKMVRISPSDQAGLSTEVQNQISTLNSLQVKISADVAANSTSSLKTDIKSIVSSYRIFALILPQGALEAAADRILNVDSMMTTIAGLLQTRISQEQSSGSSMSTSVAALADMNAKLSAASTQANAAISGIAGLQPDNGNQTVMASNLAALKAARTKVQAAQQDLVAARKDAGAIVRALIAIRVSGKATTTANATGTAGGASSSTQ